jgi:uncharacterized protein (TIGR02246 family)
MILSMAVIFSAGAWALADEPPEADDVRQIEAEVAGYVEAFNAKDAAALSKHWSETGVYVRPDDGTRLVGRAAIEKEFAASFAERPDSILAVKVGTIRFVTPDVAIEEGTAEVAASDESPSRTGYAAVHVKRDGEWQIDSIRETDLPAEKKEETAQPQNPLAELAWLVGDWEDLSEQATVETTVTWTKNKTFLSYAFKVATGGLDELEGTQVIGWDPLRKALRSWMFDSDGGLGEGAWTRKGNRWEVELRQVLADGRTASSTNIYQYVDDNTFVWQSVDREVDGQPLPDVEPVAIVRKAAISP